MGAIRLSRTIGEEKWHIEKDTHVDVNHINVVLKESHINHQEELHLHVV